LPSPIRPTVGSVPSRPTPSSCPMDRRRPVACARGPPPT